MTIATTPPHATGHVQTDDERRNDALMLIVYLSALTGADREAAHYDHVSHGCPLEDLLTNDLQHRLLPANCDCPLCANDPSPFETQADGVREFSIATDGAACVDCGATTDVGLSDDGREELCYACHHARRVDRLCGGN